MTDPAIEESIDQALAVLTALLADPADQALAVALVDRVVALRVAEARAAMADEAQRAQPAWWAQVEADLLAQGRKGQADQWRQATPTWWTRRADE